MVTGEVTYSLYLFLFLSSYPKTQQCLSSLCLFNVLRELRLILSLPFPFLSLCYIHLSFFFLSIYYLTCRSLTSLGLFAFKPLPEPSNIEVCCSSYPLGSFICTFIVVTADFINRAILSYEKYIKWDTE